VVLLGEHTCTALHFRLKKKGEKELVNLEINFVRKYHHQFAICHHMFVLVIFEDTGLDESN